MRKGESTRERIVAQAAPIFNQKGFAGCSMQDVMEATGLEKGGLYRHFCSKEELAEASFRYAWGRAVKVRIDALDPTANTVDQLRGFVRRFIEHPSTTAGGCPLLNTAVDADDGNEGLRKLALEALQDWRGRLCGVIVEGIRRGEIAKSAKPRPTANALIAALEGALMISRLEGTKTALKDVGAALEVMLDGIAAGRRRSRTSSDKRQASFAAAAESVHRNAVASTGRRR